MVAKLHVLYMIFLQTFVDSMQTSISGELCIWVLGIGGCTVELVNSLFVFLVNIAQFVLLYE